MPQNAAADARKADEIMPTFVFLWRRGAEGGDRHRGATRRAGTALGPGTWGRGTVSESQNSPESQNGVWVWVSALRGLRTRVSLPRPPIQIAEMAQAQYLRQLINAMLTPWSALSGNADAHGVLAASLTGWL